MPEQDQLTSLWDYADADSIDIELQQVNEYASVVTTATGLADSRREVPLVAFDADYFEDPRDATLGDVAVELGISQSAASGLLRRGISRLIEAGLLDER